MSKKIFNKNCNLESDLEFESESDLNSDSDSDLDLDLDLDLILVNNEENKMINIYDDNLKKNFNGYNTNNNNLVECIYCYKFYPKIMMLPNHNYCGHYWGWLNADQLNLKEGIYNGNNSKNEIFNFIKLTYPLHSLNCKNEECIYNKITSYKESKNLNKELYTLLEFEKKILNKDNINKNLYKKIKKNIKINYKLSKISI